MTKERAIRKKDDRSLSRREFLAVSAAGMMAGVNPLARRPRPPRWYWSTLEVGKVADVLVVNDDPLEDIHALIDIRMVLRNGVIIRRAQ